MPHIYLFVAEEKQGPYSEAEVKDMFAAGTITPETPYWSDEMAAWRPLGRVENISSKFRDPSTSIVPPRRSQLAGQSNVNSEETSLSPREKALEIKKLSARNQRITIPSAILMGLLFFFIMGAIFYLCTLVFPDVDAEWRADSKGGAP